MSMPRVIIADPDINYLLPLQQKFAEEYWNRIEIEVISDSEYFSSFFSTPQEADMLIVSEQFYDNSLQRHNITNIFLMSEKQEEILVDSNITRLFKYKNLKEIFNIIVGRSNINPTVQIDKVTKIIYVCSASGGVGKTTLSMAISQCLVNNYKKVLYINASHLQSFQCFLEDKTPIHLADFYIALTSSTSDIYPSVRRLIRKEKFSYLPPFKAALISLDISFNVYEKIIVAAKENNEFDYIVVDSDANFDEFNVRLLNYSDRVIIVSEQSLNSAFATNNLIANLSDIAPEKYYLVCNKYDRKKENALEALKNTKLSVCEYIWANQEGSVDYSNLASENEIQKLVFMIM